MAIHLHNSGPEFCFVDVDFTEERNFDLFKIGYFVDGPTLYCPLFLRDKHLESDLFCDSCYRLHSLQGMIAACVAVHHTTCNYVRTFDRVPGPGFVFCLCALFHYIYTCKVSSCYHAEIALPPMAFLFFFAVPNDDSFALPFRGLRLWLEVDLTTSLQELLQQCDLRLGNPLVNHTRSLWPACMNLELISPLTRLSTGASC